MIGSSNTKKLISIVVPVFNEEDNIDTCFLRISDIVRRLHNYQFEIIFTDNHSTDGTYCKLLAIARDNKAVKVVRFSRNCGFHRSVLTGYRLASGAAAIQLDADLQDPPELIEEFIKKWEAGHDVVVGVRRNRQEPRSLQAARKGYYRLLAWLDGPHLIADAGDFRLIDASIIRMLRCIDDAHPYLRGLISTLARNQAGIAYDREKRVHGRSKFPLTKLVDMGLHGIFTHSNAPLKLAFYTGTFCAVLALLTSVVFLFSRLSSSSMWPAGLATTHILLLASIALNGVFMGILDVYIGRVYDQVRSRPTAVISHAVNCGPEIDKLAFSGVEDRASS